MLHLASVPRKRWFLVHVRRAFSSIGSSDGAHQSCACIDPQPGSVKLYDAHVLIKLPRPEKNSQKWGGWWPASVERYDFKEHHIVTI